MALIIREILFNEFAIQMLDPSTDDTNHDLNGKTKSFVTW